MPTLPPMANRAHPRTGCAAARALVFAALVVFGSPAVPRAGAQEPQPPSQGGPAGDELKTLHDMLEQQSRQLDVLAQEVARLNLLLSTRPYAGGPGNPPPADAGRGPGAMPPVLPSEEPPAAAAEPAEPAQPAEPASASGPTHIITKGETLTSIAHRYKLTVPALLKVNKIADVRRLQIGQTLRLPPNAQLQPAGSPSPVSHP